MADWNQQTATIQKLRQQRRDADEALYAAQTNLLKMQSSLRKIRRKQTSPTTDSTAIEELRKKIAQLQSRLQQLDKDINAIDSVLAKLNENANLMAFLEKKIKLVSEQITELSAQLAKEQNNRQPDKK